MELGKNIAEIRKNNNLTQDDLANKYFITRQTISNWENGKSYPDLETLVKISNDFNISLDELLKGDKNMIKDITKKQKNYNIIRSFIIALYIFGILCLLYFAIPYIFHNINIFDITGAFSSNDWLGFGYALIILIIPLIIINILAYIFVDLKNKKMKLLFFIPTVICLLCIVHYFLFIVDWNEEKTAKTTAVFECYVNKNTYKYKYYSGEGWSTADHDNDILSAEIDTTNEETFFQSVNEYYKSIGGYCS